LINSFIRNDSLEISGNNIEEENNHPLFQHVVELRVSHRFKNNEGIGRFSKAVINNDQLTMEQYFAKDFDSQVSIDEFYKDELFEAFVLGYGDFINEKETLAAIKKLNNLKVLCALREGPYGVTAVNKRIEFILRKNGLLKGVGEFYENRPIMVSKNYYDLQLFNGDIGIIRPDENGEMKAWFVDNENNIRSILPGYISDAETVFAMTIHKSQGSEFDNVLLLLPEAGDISLFTSELLYTAVTRARKTVLIQGRKEVIIETANRSVKRISGIKERLLN
jgi:exodeoxyribonuclease V alpha subunit